MGLIIALSLKMSLLLGEVYADTTGCAVFLSGVTVSADLVGTNSPGEVVNSTWAAAYLNLLDVVLEGIDEVTADAFGHTDRVQVKALLLQELTAASKAIDPLAELERIAKNFSSNDPARPAIEGHTLLSRAQPSSRNQAMNLTHYSSKLSTLAESGQLHEVVANLHLEDWVQIRQTIELKLTQLQNVQTAQVIAKPVTQDDFVDKPDVKGETRLFRLIRAQKFAEAQRLVENDKFSALYLNKVNSSKETALDILFKIVAHLPKSSPERQAASSLAQALSRKEATFYGDLDLHYQLLHEAAEEGDLAEIRRLYNLGANNINSPSYLLDVVRRREQFHILRPLLALVAQDHDVSVLAQNLYLAELKQPTTQPLEVVKILLDFFPINSLIELPRISSRLHWPSRMTPFEYAAIFSNPDVMELLISRGDVAFASITPTIVHKLIELGRTSQINPKALEILAKLNINLNATDGNGATALHLAAKFSRSGLAMKLCILGVDLDAVDNEGNKAIDYVHYSNYSDSNFPADTYNAIVYCQALRRRYPNIEPRQVYYTAYLDWINLFLKEIDKTSSAEDRKKWKIWLFEKLLKNDFYLVYIPDSVAANFSVFKNRQIDADYSLYRHLNSYANLMTTVDKEKIFAIARLRLAEIKAQQGESK